MARKEKCTKELSEIKIVIIYNSIFKNHLLNRYSEQLSKPAPSSSHFSAAVSWSLRVVEKIQAPLSTKNFTMAKLLQEAAQCRGVLKEIVLLTQK